MENERSAKRRKLGPCQRDTPQQPSPTAPSLLEPSTLPFARQPTGKPSNASRQIRSTHEAWREAKAQSSSHRGRRPDFKSQEVVNGDVYDDIEGAHSRQTAWKKTAPNSTPVKKQFDPLRNQKSAEQSPTPAKSPASRDFFKQFTVPKKRVREDVTTLAATKVPNGAGAGNGEPQAQEADEDESKASAGDADAVRQEGGARPGTKPNQKGWTYDKPKKTFEDEIRELEDVARREADQDEDDATSGGAAQRRSGRAAVPRVWRDAMSKDVARSVKSSSPRSLTSSKKNAVRETTQQVHGKGDESDNRDAMNVDGFANCTQGREDIAHVEDAQVETPTATDSQPTTKAPLAIKDTSISSNHLQIIRHVLLEKLNGSRPSQLIGLHEEYTKVSSLISQTVRSGESNSMLLIGARGSGKTSLINHILREEANKHADDFHAVHLNGFIHTDDKIALREIWRQLGRKMELEDEDSASKNYADTMTRLLALLSHPVEQGCEQANLITKSVIFILDEFEMFASHPRQTLLYNLFDIAQSRKAPIAVLGLTTRIDVAESLEKRVKSRFSHRYVHVSLAKSFAGFGEACKSAISMSEKDLSAEERRKLGLPDQLDAKLESGAKKHDENTITKWNALVDGLFAEDDFVNHLKRIYYTTKSVPEFQTSMMTSLATLPLKTSTATANLLAHFTITLAASPSLRPPDSKLFILYSLSTLQLALLISAARLTNIHNCDTLPFAQAYDEYKTLASKAKLQASSSGALAQGAGSRVSGKDVARGAWEELIEAGLLLVDASRGVRVDVGLEEIGMMGALELGSWGRWCREI